jgi:hypothetical protein
MARNAALTLVLWVGLACGLDLDVGPDPNPCTGTFNGSVSGSGTAPNGNFSGCSVYSTNTNVFELRTSQSQHLITLGGSARPAVGTHSIGRWDISNPPPLNATYSNSTSSPQRVFFSESGTVTITESSTGKLKGSITVTVAERTLTPATATVTATFDANCRQGTKISC